MRVAKPLLIVTAAMTATGLAAPATASDTALTEPGEICIQDGIEANLSDALVAMLLAGAGLSDPPQNFEATARGVVTACVEEHNMETESDEAVARSRIIGRYSAARATRNETQRRLAARGVDIAWLDQGLADQLSQGQNEAVPAATAILERMALAQPEGLGIDVYDGTQEGLFITALTFGFVFSQLEVDKLANEL